MKYIIVIPLFILFAIIGLGVVLSMIFSPSGAESESVKGVQSVPTVQVEYADSEENGKDEVSVVVETPVDVESSLSELSDPYDGIVDPYEVQQMGEIDYDGFGSVTFVD